MAGAGPNARRVALIYDATRAYDLKVMTGVAAYLREVSWSVYIEESALKEQRLPGLAAWPGDGIIANFDDPRVVRAVRASRLPVVAFGSGYGWYDPASRIPYCYTNNHAIAAMAADHLLERGFRHFGYYGGVRTRTNGWSLEREAEFAARVASRGFRCSVHRDFPPGGRRWARSQGALARWLGSLDKPAGILAENDQRARVVLEVCRAAGIRVPEQLAVIGVDNDELLCQLSTPLLSSVEQGSKRIGYEAAALLDTMMRGRRPRRLSRIVDPIGVVVRGSTDILAIEDLKVAEAMRFIWEHACDGLHARDVAGAVGVSRSGLDAHFKAALSRTVRESIRRVQLEKVIRLLPEALLSLKEIAAKAGYKSVQHMTTCFGAAYGRPPAAYRRDMNRLRAP
jgi:LacI family transcriptional regulator